MVDLGKSGIIVSSGQSLNPLGQGLSMAVGEGLDSLVSFVVNLSFTGLADGCA